MFKELPDVLDLLGTTCASAQGAMPAGTIERKNMLCAQQLAVQTIIENWESDRHAGELLSRLEALVPTMAQSAEPVSAGAFQAALAETGEIFRKRGRPVDELVTLEYELHEKNETFYRKRMAALRAGGEGAAADDREFDGDKLAAFLSEKAGGAPVRFVTMRRVPGGFSKITLIVAIASGGAYPDEVVVRLDRSFSHLQTKVADEYEIIGLLHQAGVKVPRPIAQEPTGSVLGTPFNVVAALPGRTIGDMFNLPPANPSINEAIAAEYARLHAVPLEKVEGVLKNVGGTRKQTETWLEQTSSEWKGLGFDSAIIDAGLAWLHANLHLAEGEPVVMHGDLGLNNILIDGTEVSALLDWEFVQAGHAAFDLGYFHSMASALGKWEDFLAAYERAGGHLPSQETLDFYMLFASVRLAVWIWLGAANFEKRVFEDIMWVTPCAHDKRVATMRVAEHLLRIRKGENPGGAA